MASDEQPAGPAPTGDAPPPASGAARTESGYSYTVVGEGVKTARQMRWPRPGRGTLRIAAIVAAAAAFAAGGWFAARALDDGGGDGSRANANVANVINAFSQGDSGVVRRFEGEMPPGIPDGLPAYPSAHVLSAISQVDGEDAAFLVIWDTPDGRDDVVSFFDDALEADPWQTNGGQETRDITLRQFTRIDDSDIEGAIVIAESKSRDVTTIVLSLQVLSGAGDDTREPFRPGVSRLLPEGFPADVPVYPDAVVIEAAFQREPRQQSFAVSLVTTHGVSRVLDYYRERFSDLGWSVSDGDPTGVDLDDAEAIIFDGDGVDGRVVAGTFAEDRDYTRVEIQLSATPK